MNAPPLCQTVREALLLRSAEITVGLKHEARLQTWQDHIADASTISAKILSALDHRRPTHVGVLLDNGPDMLRQLAAAALGGYVLCAINSTRRGHALGVDILRGDCQLLITDEGHHALLEGLELPGVKVITVGDQWWIDASLVPEPARPLPIRPESPFALVFTSGTSGEPKAVPVSHRQTILAGQLLAQRFALTSDDTCYLSMPLFHSNAILAGWAVAVASGAAMAPSRFSASQLLGDIRRYQATYMNYVGKPLAYILDTPARPDDADNTLRVAFGNEANERDIAIFAQRFGVEVVDAYGSTEGAISLVRDASTPRGSIGRAATGVAVFDPTTVTECEVAEFDSGGALANGERAVGELVNTTGGGMFAGYYNDSGSTSSRLRRGMYWSGDLAYRDSEGWVYLAGRTSDWMRVDGENMATAPLERMLLRHSSISQAAVYAVPDGRVGDQVMAAIVVRPGDELTTTLFEQFLSAQSDLSLKGWPRYVRITKELPTTATHKVVKTELISKGCEPREDIVWGRTGREHRYQQL